MKQVFAFIILIHLSFAAFSQSFQLGVFGGTANYEGDLGDEPFKPLNPSLGVTLTYHLTDRLSVRAGYMYAKVGGADTINRTSFIAQVRNLSFETKLSEFSVLGEYNILNIENIRWSPYLFGGLAFFHYNPYTKDASGRQVYLRPLSTEGQGLSQYPERKPYSLNQIAIPFGGGIKYAVNDRIQLGLELGLRRLFTDYLDDISTTYVDPAILLAERGQTAVDLSYRGDEYPGEATNYPDNGYPESGTTRGSTKANDWYYTTGLHINFRLGGNSDGSGGIFRRGGRRGYGCPTVPQ